MITKVEAGSEIDAQVEIDANGSMMHMQRRITFSELIQIFKTVLIEWTELIEGRGSSSFNWYVLYTQLSSS